MKHLLLLVLLAINGTAFANNFPVDSLTHQVSFKQTFKLSTQITTDKVYGIAQGWFKNSPGIFTQKNAINPTDTLARKAKNKPNVDKEFDNSAPLQMLDPAGQRVQGLGLLKYYNGNGSSIKLIYVKYDINLQVEAGKLTMHVTNVRYWHFDPKSYQLTGIYSFGGGKPCDYTGSAEHLIECTAGNKETGALGQFFAKQLNALAADLKNTLKANKALYEPGKTPAKTPAKTTTASKGGSKTSSGGKKN